jgi:membrane protein required for colicin V production
MNILDIIIILCFIPILISGYKKGLISQVISIVGLMAGVWMASALGDNVGAWFKPMMEGHCDDPQGMAYLAGFAVTLVAVLLIFLVFGKLIEKIILLAIPDVINSLLGLALAAVNGTLLLCTLYLIFNVLNKIYMFTDLKTAFFSDSLIFPIIESTSNALLPNLLKLFL